MLAIDVDVTHCWPTREYQSDQLSSNLLDAFLVLFTLTHEQSPNRLAGYFVSEHERIAERSASLGPREHGVLYCRRDTHGKRDPARP